MEQQIVDCQSESESYESDSDKELQVAFQKGLLKGLVYESRPTPTFINNKIGLQESLANLKNGLNWIERLDLSVKAVRPPKALEEQLGDNPDDLSCDNINDDFKRENKFYRQGQAAVLESVPRLHALGIPTRRPDDYFAEMVKSDQHMKKIKENLMSIQAGKERSEKAKKLREMRKFGKQVQKDVLEKRSKEKKKMLEAVKKYKKGQTSDLDFLSDKPKNKKDVNKKKEVMEPNKKRQLKNKKFGFGGQKKRSKHNTKSSNDDISFSFKKKMNQKPSNKNRPGKRRRQNSKKH